MYPKTLCGWYNKLVRDYPYNEQTAHILDHSFKISPRLLSTLVNRNRRLKSTDFESTKRLFPT